MRNLPLYQATQGIKFAELDFPNGGLWFEKFFSDFTPNYSEIDTEKQMNNDIVQPKVMPTTQVLEKYVKRQTKLVHSQGGITKVFTNDWHFVTGMGQNHPIENGFAWHSLLGVPYLAGSGIKGVLRHWVKYYLEDKALEQKWFGSDDDKNPYAGELLFFDALPIDKPVIVVDVMTPHYGTWYQDGANGSLKNAPHDAHEPIPIKFLVVKNASLAFSIAPRVKTKEGVKQVEHAFAELTTALEFLGAGAKTGTGYGRFSLNESENSSLSDKLKRESQSPLITEIEKLATDYKAQGSAPNCEASTQIWTFFVERAIPNLENYSSEEKDALKALVKSYKVSKKKEKEFKTNIKRVLCMTDAHLAPYS